MSSLLFGVHENIDPAQTVARVGGNATRVFTAGVIRPRDLVKAATAVCGPSWDAGVTAVWSFKPHPDDVTSRAWQPYVAALGEFLHAHPDKRTVVVIWHEPENDVGEWFPNAAGFTRLFDTVAGWLRATHPSAVVCHAALAYRYGDGRDITDTVARTWRTTADLHCIDIYSGRTNPLDTIMPDLSSYRRWREFVADGQRWGVTERGWSIGTIGKGGTAAQRVAAMAREANWLSSLEPAAQPEVYLLWSTGGTEGDEGLVFDAGADQVARTITGHYAGREAARVAAAVVAATDTTDTTGTATASTVPAPAHVHEVTCPLCAGSGKYRFTA